MGTYYRCPACNKWVVDKTAEEHSAETHPPISTVVARWRFWRSIDRRLRRTLPPSLRFHRGD